MGLEKGREKVTDLTKGHGKVWKRIGSRKTFISTWTHTVGFAVRCRQLIKRDLTLSPPVDLV